MQTDRFEMTELILQPFQVVAKGLEGVDSPTSTEKGQEHRPSVGADIHHPTWGYLVSERLEQPDFSGLVLQASARLGWSTCSAEGTSWVGGLQPVALPCPARY